jgi:hypothetical protein
MQNPQFSNLISSKNPLCDSNVCAIILSSGAYVAPETGALFAELARPKPTQYYRPPGEETAIISRPGGLFINIKSFGI